MSVAAASTDTELAMFALLVSIAETACKGRVVGVHPPPEPTLPAGLRVVGLITGDDHGVFTAQEIYFGFVASDGRRFYVIIRGTEHFLEWIEDAEFGFVSHPYGGRVEVGFWTVYQSLRCNKLPFVDGIRVLVAQSDVVVIGHSLGGPLATHAAFDLTRAGLSVECYPIACPKPGDTAFAAAFAAAVPNHLVVNYSIDLVPHLPTIGGFVALPNTHIITPTTARAKIKFSLGCNHAATSYIAMLDPATYARTTQGECVSGKTAVINNPGSTTMTTFKTGCSPRQFSDMPRVSSLRARASALPPLPVTVDNVAKLPAFVGMMKNDTYGDCTCAGMAHLIQLWTGDAAGVMLTEPDAQVLEAYRDITGFDLATGKPDLGAAEQEVLRWWQKTGFPMADGTRHKIGPVYEANPRNLLGLCEVIWEFGAAYVGFEVPGGFMEELPTIWWDNPAYSTIEGGHCVILTGFNRTDPNPNAWLFDVTTWGTNRQFKMRADFLTRYVNEAYGIVSSLWIEANGKTPYDIDLAILEAIGGQIGQQLPVAAPAS